MSSLIPFFVLVAGLVASVFLVQQQQEIREKAAPQPCYVCQGAGVCQKIADPPYCNLGDSECFVNEDCIAPTSTPTPTPATCEVKYEDRGCGRNNCSQTSMWQLVTNADCTVSSRCVPNHSQCLPTPTPTPHTCTLKTENRGCGRNNCSQTSMWQMVTNADCTTTSRCVPNHPQCSSTPTPTPTPAKCEDSKTVEQCDAQKPFCAWYQCSNKCLPIDTSYVEAGCAESCPRLPGSFQTCGFNGQTCESQEAPSVGQLYMCQEGTWQVHGELNIVFDNNCSAEEKNKYRDNIGILPLELHTNETIKISCPDEGQKFTVIIDNTEYETTACGLFGGNTVTLSCNDPLCRPSGSYLCQNIVVHEFAHNHGGTIGLSSHEIESFNKAIGCRSDGKGSFSFEETPVTAYGETNCAEAYAELIENYVLYPCLVANNPGWPRQYDWLITNPDSPFQGKELCKEGQ